MYVDKSTVRVGNKVYARYLLRESCREGKKIKHRTIANISRCSPQEIEAIHLAPRYKNDLSQIGVKEKSVTLKQGLSVGALWVLYDMARQLGGHWGIAVWGSLRCGR